MKRLPHLLAILAAVLLVPSLLVFSLLIGCQGKPTPKADKAAEPRKSNEASSTTPAPSSSEWLALVDNGDKPGNGYLLVKQGDKLAGTFYLLEPGHLDDLSAAGQVVPMQNLRQKGREITFSITLKTGGDDFRANCSILLKGDLKGDQVKATFQTKAKDTVPIDLIFHRRKIKPSADVKKAKPQYVIVIHGGAGNISKSLPEAEQKKYLTGLTEALTKGVQVLREGGTSLDAVEQTIKLLEDNPHFNAGKGAVFNQKGHHELDASIMDGRNLACGAVAAARTAKNPISLARMVMEKSDQVLFVGSGADEFASKMKVKNMEPSYFFTPSLRELWQKIQTQDKESAIAPTGFTLGTVGVVALDIHGNLAAGTSTGGLLMKPPGRVGDSPLIGAGTYANNETCAVSCSGAGEEFIRHAVAHDLSARMMHKGQTLKEAAEYVLHKTLKPGTGGLIALAKDGTVVVEFNTSAMFRGVADSKGRFDCRIQYFGDVLWSR